LASSYYNYKFTDTKALYARIKEEFSSYFESGLLDDTLMDSYTVDCLEDIGKGSHKISHTLIKLEDNHAELPDDFYDIREVWISHLNHGEFELPGATYVQKMKDTAHKLWEDVDVRCCPCDSCANPNKVEAIYKVNRTILFSWERKKLLLPQPIMDIRSCRDRYIYDVQDCKLVSPIQDGWLELVYYEDAYKGDGNLAIPDNFRIKRYIEEYLKYKLYFKLFNSVTDESINIIKVKYEEARQLYLRARDSAIAEARKLTMAKRIERMNAGTRKMNKYELPRTYYRRRR